VIDGLWVLQYEGIQGSGGAALVFVNGEILGGDNGFTFIGTFAIKDGTISAKVKVQNYLKSVTSFFGFEGDYEVLVSGKVQDNLIHAKAEIVGRGVPGLALKLTRVKKLLG
jgi:T3SS negative regulator,GrlR